MNQSKEFLQSLLSYTKYNKKAIGFQLLTVDNTAGGIALTVPENSTYALVVVESSVTVGVVVRYLEVGPTVSTVTSANGIPRSHLDAFDIQGTENLRNFRIIQTTAGTHTISVQYYK